MPSGVRYGMSHIPKYAAGREREYIAWSKARNNSQQHGLEFHAPWTRFDTFFTEVGAAPEGHVVLGRVDLSRGYTPGNCKWMTKKERQTTNGFGRPYTYK